MRNPPKIVCLTMDFEEDYGDRVGAFNILQENRDEWQSLAEWLHKRDLPMSLFIRMDMLQRHPGALEMARAFSNDLHCHSYSHDTKSIDNRNEIRRSKRAFQELFDRNPLGYRAPQGVLRPGDSDTLKAEGFAFSSSIFPSFRPGKFNNLRAPLEPHHHPNGLREFPMAVIPGLRIVLSLSYMKLLGPLFFRRALAHFGSPEVLVFDTHLHDFIVNERSFASLPMPIRVAYGIRKKSGFQIFKNFVADMQATGAEFLPISALLEREF